METAEHLIGKQKQTTKIKSMLVIGFPRLYWTFREEIDLMELVPGFISSKLPFILLNS